MAKKAIFTLKKQYNFISLQYIGLIVTCSNLNQNKLIYNKRKIK